MKSFSLKLFLISISMAIIMLFSVLFMSYIKSDKTIATREINVSEIGSLSYEEKMNKIYDQFQNIETKNQGQFSYFSGEINLDTIDFLSTGYEGDEFVNSYSSVMDNYNETISISKDLVIDGEVVETNEYEFATEYNEETEQFFFIDEEGNKIDILSELDNDNLDECLVLSMTAVTAIVAFGVLSILFVGTVSENADQIGRDIENLWNGIKDGCVSFWESLRLAFGAITAVKLTEAISILTVAQAETIYKKAIKRKDQYLLLGTITGDAPIPILYKFTNIKNARNWIKKGGSIWSPYKTTTKNAIKSANYLAGGFNYDTKAYQLNLTEHHYNPIFPTFEHYHTLNKKLKRVNLTCHGFFGLPYKGE